MVCNSERVVVNHSMLFGTNGCESWCDILSQWLLIMVSFAEEGNVNHGAFYYANGCES